MQAQDKLERQLPDRLLRPERSPRYRRLCAIVAAASPLCSAPLKSSNAIAAMTAMLATSKRRSSTQIPKMSANGCLARFAKQQGPDGLAGATQQEDRRKSGKRRGIDLPEFRVAQILLKNFPPQRPDRVAAVDEHDASAQPEWVGALDGRPKFGSAETRQTERSARPVHQIAEHGQRLPSGAAISSTWRHELLRLMAVRCGRQARRSQISEPQREWQAPPVQGFTNKSPEDRGKKALLGWDAIGLVMWGLGRVRCRQMARRCPSSGREQFESILRSILWQAELVAPRAARWDLDTGFAVRTQARQPSLLVLCPETLFWIRG